MIEIEIPGRGMLRLQHLVSDVNGTLAVDGKLIEGVARAVTRLRDRLTIHLITADTHGHQALIDRQLGLTAVRIQGGDEAAQKAAYVRQLGAERVAAIGQGANDSAMLREAALGICVLSPEGTATASMLSADILVSDILAGLELFEKPLRLVATLRR